MQIAQLLLREILGRGVDRREVRGLGLAVEVVRGDREAVPVRTAAEPHPRAGNEPLLQPGLVEPCRLDLAGAVSHLRRQYLEPAASPARGRADDALDDGLLVPEEVADPLRRHGLLVSPRSLQEDVLSRDEPDPRESPRQGRADPLERLDRRCQALEARRRARAWPDIRPVHAGESRRRARASHRPLHSRPL